MAPLPYILAPRHPISATDRPPDDGWGPHDGDARWIGPPPVHRIDDPWLPHGPRRRLNQGYRRGVQRRDLFSAHEPTTTPPHALTYTRQDDELLDWVFPSLGMLGIVTRMTLKMVPSYKLRATCTVMSLADFQARACTHAPCLRATLHPHTPCLHPCPPLLSLFQPSPPSPNPPALVASQLEIFDISRNNEYTRFIFYPTNKQASVWPVP